MSPSRNLAASVALGMVLALSACSSLPKFGNSKAKEKSAEDKAGRITMVLSDEAIKANPELANVEITLPDPVQVSAWTEAGANASKVVGHVVAAPELKIAWRANVGAGSDRKSAITTPPVTSETTVYTLDADQTVVATNLANGKRVWSKKLKGLTKRDKTALGGGLGISGDTLIVASGFGFVASLDASNGTEKWKRELGAPMTGAPTIKDGRIFVASNNNEVFALNFATGETEWSDQAIAESARVLGSSSPAAVEDFVIAPYSSGEIIAYLASNGRRLWTDAISQAGRFTPISEINDIGSRPVLAGGLVFASSQSGVTIAIDGRSGNRVWAVPIGSVQAPALAGPYMFVLGTDDTLAALNAANGEAYWVTPLRKFKKEKKKKGRISYSGPIVASGRILIVSSLGELLAFSPQTGQQTGSVKLGSTVYLEPIAVQDKLLILTDEAKLIAIQ
ncbi:PQQ-like beta-propeller repeat protein [Hyphomonas johnsonii]|jgi:outer membrane protein assembly factor BamB|uniref:PQQ repeat-containing protein n=1 Tax=Hyphomonas johnsonii MHS-2 TaxID=1280950 RepID=A0A059FAH6_9PROT|nr:PQQ-like beta-propeller repeat protein [Hyphomonas johnsonii]KCZ87624.1 PQQ repeat-containing protein [Hyphomonas johnsonii MHS-2]